MKIHQPTGRPIVDGLPVPYITRWVSEVNENEPFGITYGASGDPMLTYLPDSPAGMDRDGNGLLWLRDHHRPDDPDSQPQWSAVHALRIRRSSHGRRCQVCARKFPAEAPLTFVHNKPTDDQVRDLTLPYTTVVPPTCRTCAPWAAVLCPNLRGTGATFVEVDTVTPVGAAGAHYLNLDVYFPARVLYNDPRIPMFIAKQPLLRLSNYRVLPMPPLERKD